MLIDQIQSDLVAAMKAGDEPRRDALRAAKTAIKNEEVAKQHSLGDEEVLQVLARLVKQLVETAAEYRKLGDEARAKPEEARAEILKPYLPEQLSDDELIEIVDTAIVESGATGPTDMGQVMSRVKPIVGARADGGRLAALVRGKLAA